MPNRSMPRLVSLMLLIGCMTACLPQPRSSQSKVTPKEVVPESNLSNGSSSTKPPDSPGLLAPKATTVKPEENPQPLLTLPTALYQLDWFWGNLPEKYKTLQTLLIAGNFKAADQETQRLMLQVYPLDHPERYEDPHWKPQEISCPEIQTINGLWERYSNGRFGWAIQKRLSNAAKQKEREDFEQIEKETNPATRQQLQEIYEDGQSRFWRQVGWAFYQESPGTRRVLQIRDYDQLIFTQDAPIGHLPTFALRTGQKGGIAGWFWDKTLGPRLDACKV